MDDLTYVIHKYNCLTHGHPGHSMDDLAYVISCTHRRTSTILTKSCTMYSKGHKNRIRKDDPVCCCLLEHKWNEATSRLKNLWQFQSACLGFLFFSFLDAYNMSVNCIISKLKVMNERFLYNCLCVVKCNKNLSTSA